jgi:hypothetical protein
VVVATGEEPGRWLSEGYRDWAVGLKARVKQLGNWMTAEARRGEEGSFERLEGLGMPVLVVNGHVSPRLVCCDS